MGFRYKTQCVDTASILHDVIAADCPTLTGDGVHIIQCTPSATDINVTLTEIATGTTINRAFIPDQLACNAPTISDTVELAWMVGGVWVAAWTFKMIAQVIRGK